MLVIGVEGVAAKGEFDDRVNRIAARFEGPLAIAVARGAHLEGPTKSRLHILVPITGTEVSLQAAEVGLAIARATKAPITALYVSAGKSTRMSRRLRNAVETRDQAETILKEAVEMADRYDIDMRTAVKTEATVADAILRQAGASRSTLIVLGVNRRPGERLFFGDVAAAILERSQRSILFVSSPRALGTPQDSGAAKPAQSRSERSRQSP
jgi:nucleotide-binding universal stress UspA family protein